MNKEQLCFLIFTQMPNDYIADFLDVKEEKIETTEIKQLYKTIKEKVETLTQVEIQMYVEKYDII